MKLNLSVGGKEVTVESNSEGFVFRRLYVDATNVPAGPWATEKLIEFFTHDRKDADLLFSAFMNLEKIEVSLKMGKEHVMNCVGMINHIEKTKDGCRGTLDLRASAVSIKSEIKR